MEYDVILTRDATESVVVRVTANSPEEAERVALRQAGKYGENLSGWELDEGNLHCPYTNDDCATEAEIQQC
jgi:hypothetical protein